MWIVRWPMVWVTPETCCARCLAVGVTIVHLQCGGNHVPQPASIPGCAPEWCEVGVAHIVRGVRVVAGIVR